MASAIRTKVDIQEYATAFSTNQFQTFASYYTPDINLFLTETVLISGRDNIVTFFTEQRKVINEKLVLEGIILDDNGCAIRADVTFTALTDMEEGYFDMPPIKKGQGYNAPFLIWYTLTKEGKIAEIRVARCGATKIVT